MHEHLASQLNELNKHFYAAFAADFSVTRQRLQPGVIRLLPRLLKAPAILDLGCGNGWLAGELYRRGYTGSYTGVDASPGLLAAGQATPLAQWIDADLGDSAQLDRLPPGPFDAITLFAVLHHIPGQARRLALLQAARQRLTAQGWLALSNWQFLESERLRKRVQPWSRLKIDPADLDPGDCLLDWRRGGEGLRYVHHFDEAELSDLAIATGFRVHETYTSDGENGRLGLYQIWQVA